MPYQYEVPVHGSYFPTQRSTDPRDPVNHRVIPHAKRGKNFQDFISAFEELAVRFDTNPHNYLKSDYLKLLDFLQDSFTYLYLEPSAPTTLEKIEYSLLWPIQRWKLEAAVKGVFNEEGDNLLLQESEPYYERLATGDFYDRIGEETLDKLWRK